MSSLQKMIIKINRFLFIGSEIKRLTPIGEITNYCTNPDFSRECVWSIEQDIQNYL
jgi:hypothetical protein